MTAHKHGQVIAIDGPDGVGKTTQVQLLADYFQKQGRTVYLTRSSGGTPIGEALRAVSLSSNPRPPMTDFYISLAMSEALAAEIAKRKAAGQVIIIDRSPLTTAAYNGYGEQLPDKAGILKTCGEMVKSWQIDQLIILEADQNLLEARRHQRKVTDYFEKLDKRFHDRVRKGYHEAQQFLQDQNIVPITVIDASLSIQRVHKSILDSLT